MSVYRLKKALNNNNSSSYDFSSSEEDNTFSLDSTDSSSEIINNKIVNSKYKRVICDVCGKEYCTNNSGKHRATKYHKMFLNFNRKFINLFN